MGVHEKRAMLFIIWIPAVSRKIVIDLVQYKQLVCAGLLETGDDKEAPLNIFSRSDSVINFLFNFKRLHINIALFFEAIWACY
jgi:hypothetical protein